MRKNYLYERSLGKWVQYDETMYLELRRERIKKCRRMRRKKRCLCSKQKQWRCDGMCEGCPYEKNEDISLNTLVGASGGLTLEDVLTDGRDQESIFIKQIHAKNILEYLDKVMPQMRIIGVLRIKGMTDCQISEYLGISRMAMYRLIAKAEAEVHKRFEEI